MTMTLQSPADSGTYPLPTAEELRRAQASYLRSEAEPVNELDVLYPLSELLSEKPKVSIRRLDRGGADMPEPYRSLLVHELDMTSTLERFHGEEMELSRLESRRSDVALLRQVLLVGRRTGEVREAGAIRIDLGQFDTTARWEILEGSKPLGAILADHRIDYSSRPRLFFAFDADERTDRLLGLRAGAQTLYGRQNVLSTASGVLAEVVEILPPTT